MNKIKVNNLPSYAREYNYITVRESEGEWYFYGAFNFLPIAMSALQDFHQRGKVLTVEQIA